MLTAVPERAATVRYSRHRSSLTRQRILEASIHLFSRKGFPRTTVRDIARQAGITDAAIYYHFATKRELLRDIINTSLQPGSWIAEQHQRPGVREQMQEVVYEAVRGAARAIEENHEVLRIILRESLAGDPAATRRYRQLLDDWESRLSARLRPFESTGALASGEARQLARQIMYIIILAFEDMLLLRRNPSMHPAERRQQMLVFLLRHVDRLLPPTGNSPAPPGEIAAVADGRRTAL